MTTQTQTQTPPASTPTGETETTAPRSSLLRLAGVLLRSPERLLGEPETGRLGLGQEDDAELESRDSAERLAALAPGLLALTLFGGALFGIVLGSYRGDIQYLYAGVKTPLLLLLPVLVGLPAIRAVHGACELQLSWSRLGLAALIAVSRTAVLAAALGPVLWLYLSLGPSYHRAILAMAASLVLVGLPGLWTLTRCLPTGGHNRALATFASVAVIGLLLAQSGWLLRPFIARPTAEVTFLRPVEADVFSSLASTRRSAAGNYRGWDMGGAGLLGRRAGSEPGPDFSIGFDPDLSIGFDPELLPLFGPDFEMPPEPDPVEGAPVDRAPVSPDSGSRTPGTAVSRSPDIDAPADPTRTRTQGIVPGDPR